MSMAPIIDSYPYPGPKESCRDGRHFTWTSPFGNEGGGAPVLGKCGFCGTSLCSDFHGDQFGDGFYCALPDGHSGHHQNRHYGEWWR